ncbi:MAG: histidine phosphatase family protein [Caldilineaceae bacterium]|nr:histidine phosphatase family protein [Caldilineaceae bacterium]
MPKTEIILIRHGETEWNAEGRIQGQGDSPLTEWGIHQAQAVGKRLQHEPFTALYASHLGRVIETARYIAAVTGHAITIDERLQERAYGIFEGLTQAEAQAAHTAIFQEYKTNFSPDFAVPQAESSRQVLARGRAVFQELAQRHVGERIVVVSHGSFLRSVLAAILGVELGAFIGFRLANGSLSEIVFEANEWQVVTLGEVQHIRAYRPTVSR